MPGFDLYIFDLDGTLLDTFADIANSVNILLADLGYPTLDAPVIHRYIGQGARWLLAESLKQAGADPVADLPRARARFLDIYRAHMLDHTDFYPHALDILHELRASGAHISLCSNKPEALVLDILEGLGQRHLFREVLGGDSLARKKPDPLPLQYILDSAQIAPSRSLMIGDSIYDIIAGRHAQTWTCGVTYGNHSLDQLQQEGAHFIVNDLLSLRSLQPPKS